MKNVVKETAAHCGYFGKVELYLVIFFPDSYPYFTHISKISKTWFFVMEE